MARSKQAEKDAIALLKADHRQVEDWFEQFEKARDSERKQELATKICNALKVHTTIEEEIFYPAYRDAVKKKDDRVLYQEALEEHHVVDVVLPEVKAADPASEVFAAKAKVLKELIEHHAGEEEKDMFKTARKVLDRDELRELGAQMQERKKQLKAEGSPRLGQEASAAA